MVSEAFITIADVPVGYTVPPFPSLYWPVDNEQYTLSFLYYMKDIWRFTVFWTLIFFAVFYGAAGTWACVVHRGKFTKTIWIPLVYLLLGLVQALLSGTVVGLVAAAIYSAGLFAMSTWIPLCAGVAQILFNVVTSYSIMASIL